MFVLDANKWLCFLTKRLEFGILFKHLCLTCGSQRCFSELNEHGASRESAVSASADLLWDLRLRIGSPSQGMQKLRVCTAGPGVLAI